MDASRSAVLVVDDDPMVETALKAFVETRGYSFSSARGVTEATSALATKPFDAVLLDLHLPDGDGMAVLDRALELDPPPAVLIMTGRADLHGAVVATRRGASDYLAKPLDFEDLGVRLGQALERASMRRKLTLLEAQHKEHSSAVARSSAMKEALMVAARVAATPASSA